MNDHWTRCLATFPIAALVMLSYHPAAAAATEEAHFSGTYIEGDGDVRTLDSLNAAFESTRPSPHMPACRCFTNEIGTAWSKVPYGRAGGFKTPSAQLTP